MPKDYSQFSLMVGGIASRYTFDASGWGKHAFEYTVLHVPGFTEAFHCMSATNSSTTK